MDNYKELIHSIQDNEAKGRLEEVFDAMEEMSHKQPVTGFHPRFYVPGWIGSIQSFIVSTKMDKWSKLPFIKEKNYYEFGDWIGETAHFFHEYFLKEEVKNCEDYNSQSNEIAKLIHVLLLMWVECSPEVATYTDTKYHDDKTDQDYEVSMAFLLNKKIESEIGNPSQTDDNERTKESGWKEFKNEAKSFGYMLAGYFVNLLILAIIAGLIDAIASLFK